jgi:hypothetical protein
MGRGMVILTFGAIIVLGIIKMGMYDQRQRIQGLTSEYAMNVQAKNTSHSAIQLAMEKINQDPSWKPTQNAPWETEIDGSHIELYYEVLSTGATITEPDTIRIYSQSWYGGAGTNGSSTFKNTSQDHTVISTYLKTGLHYVPEPRGGLGLGTSNFTFNMGGSSTISGNDASGTCDDLPAIATPSFLDQTKVTLGTSDLSSLQSTDQKVSNDPDMSYEPVDELIARLSTQPGVKSISGNYKGDFGSADDPGIFFVESYAKLTGGIPEGYGILVIRSGGELEYEGALSVAGNFTFNGLIVFENAFDFDGKGTPDLNGSVLIGNTPGNSTTIDIDLGGNLQIQYDCEAIDYARIAAAEHLKQNRYILVSTFE